MYTFPKSFQYVRMCVCCFGKKHLHHMKICKVLQNILMKYIEMYCL